MCFVKRLFWRFSENSQGSTHGGVLFEIAGNDRVYLSVIFHKEIYYLFSRTITNDCFWVSYLNWLTFGIFLLTVISHQFSHRDLKWEPLSKKVPVMFLKPTSLLNPSNILLSRASIIILITQTYKTKNITITRLYYLFLSKFCQKILNCQFRLKFGT